MFKKQFLLKTVFSSLLIIALLAVLIALGGYALAQEGATETGDGEAYATTPNTETAPKAALPGCVKYEPLVHFRISSMAEKFQC